MSEGEQFTELIYDDKEIEDVIKKEYPSAIIEDASDSVHQNRFEVRIDGVTSDEFYPFAMKEGFVLACFSFQLKLRGVGNDKKKNKEDIERWMEAAGIEKEPVGRRSL